MAALFDMSRRVTMHDVNPDVNFDDMEADVQDFFTDSNQAYYDRHQYVNKFSE